MAYQPFQVTQCQSNPSEEQQWYYLIHSWEGQRGSCLSHGSKSKCNCETGVETYSLQGCSQAFNHYTVGDSLWNHLTVWKQ